MPLITGKTKLLGVIGSPVEHSLSPIMHNAAIANLELDYVYVPFPIQAEDLEKAIAGFEAMGVVGFSITIPHKLAIIPFLSEITDIARQVGAVNTVWRSDTGWKGTNTDVAGFLAPLKTLSRDWSQVTPVVLGNGGAARAVVAGCAELGCRVIHVVGRDRSKLDYFKQSWLETSLYDVLNVHTGDKLAGLVSETQLLINTTPSGMSPKINESPINIEILQQLPRDAVLYDLIYTPNPTLLLQQAKEQGATIIDGLEMLVQQGAIALELWLGQPVPIEIMRQALRQHLRL